MRRCTGLPDDHGERQIRRRFVRSFTGLAHDGAGGWCGFVCGLTGLTDDGAGACGRRFVRSFTGLTNDGTGACGRRFMRSFAGFTDDGAGEYRRRFVRSCMGLPVEMLLACVFACRPLVMRQFHRPSTEGVCHVD